MTKSNLIDEIDHKKFYKAMLIYYLVLCFYHSSIEPTAPLFKSLVAGGFLLFWTGFAGGVVWLVGFPLITTFIKIPKSIGDFFLNYLHYAVPLTGFAILLMFSPS